MNETNNPIALTAHTLWSRLHYKIAMGTTVFTTLILFAAFSFFYVSNSRERTNEFFQRANVKADIVYRSLETAMIYKSPETARAVVKEMVERLSSSGEFSYLAVIDIEGNVWVSTNPSNEGRPVDNRNETCLPCHRKPEDKKPFNSWILPKGAQGEVYRIASVFQNGTACYQCHSSQNAINGVLVADFPMTGFKAALSEELRNLLIVLIVSLGAMLFSLRYLLLRIVVKRIQNLSERTRRIGQGELPPPAPVKGSDELSQIERDFNEMCQGLIEKKKKNEELIMKLIQQEKLAVIGQLVAGIAHDVNTPLGIVLSRLECLKLEADNVPMREGVVKDLEVIERQIKRLARTVQGLLAFSKQAPIQFENVRMRNIIHEAVEACRPSFERRRIRLRWDCPSDLPFVYGNPIQFEQMLINLLNNACDAVKDQGTVQLRALGKKENIPPGIQLIVEDDGPGFPDELVKTVFLPFVTTKKSEKGTGLGLAIVSQIVSQHGGNMLIGRSALGGALFEIFLPAHDPAKSYSPRSNDDAGTIRENSDRR